MVIKTKEEILNDNSVRYGELLDNPRAIILATEALIAMELYANQKVMERDVEIEKWVNKYYHVDKYSQDVIYLDKLNQIFHPKPKDN